jgi:cysteine desulfurase
MKPIYLDHSATTPIRAEVLDVMRPYFSDTFGNASSIHGFGQKARKDLEEARKKVKDVCFNGHTEKRLPNVSNISFHSVDGESLLLVLDSQKIAVSTGAACSSGSAEVSHVLTAMGLSPELAGGSTRFSLGRLNSEDDIRYVLDVLPDVIAGLRK